MKKTTLAAAAAGAVLAVGWAGPALAQTYPPPPPTDTGVLTTQFVAPPAVAPPAVAPASVQNEGARGVVLPFTGQQIGTAAALGGVSVALGAVLVLLGRRRRVGRLTD